MNEMKSLYQFSVFFWALSLSLAIHGLVLIIPVNTAPTKPLLPPLETISLIPLPQERNTPTSQTPPSQTPLVPKIQILPTPIASPSASPIPQPSNLQELPPTENREEVTPPNSKVTPTTKPIAPKPIQQDSTRSERPNPGTTTPEIESSEEFRVRTQKAFTQVTERIEKQYGNRFARRSETIAASPELFFTQPELFYDNKGAPRSGFNGEPFQIEKENPEQVFKAYEETLKESGFTALALENYGGGLLYEIKAKKEGSPEKVAFYLNLLLSPDKSGTIVVIWKTRPQK